MSFVRFLVLALTGTLLAACGQPLLPITENADFQAAVAEDGTDFLAARRRAGEDVPDFVLTAPT